MNLEFLIEVGCEEIPAGLVSSLPKQLCTKIETLLSQKGISYDLPQGYGTPRRLVVTIPQVDVKQADRTEFITGPPLASGYDASGQPTKAALGFARKYDMPVAALQSVETAKGWYVGFERKIPGISTVELLSEGLPHLLADVEFPKGMRWDASRFEFIRPIRWLLCLFGGRVVPFQVAGIQTADFTFGHRFLADNSKVQVNTFGDYYLKLHDLNVELIPEKRRDRIRTELEVVCRGQGGKLFEDDQLLVEVTNLHEFPSVVCGSFDSRFLALPQEVLVTVMKVHQKYFSMVDTEGRLMPRFLAVVDSDPNYASMVVPGHERVLKARLEDASFYWDKDCHVSLESRIPHLKKIVFHAELGSMFEKTQRLVKLVEALAPLLGRSDLLEPLREAARLCKADLTTEMVKEFTNLQGVMGGLYARTQGLPETVANAIYEHYHPVAWDDAPPHSVEGALLSIADKLDSIVSLFCIGLLPSGSGDPLGLRRQTLGILNVILNKRQSISLEKLYRMAFKFVRKKDKRRYPEVRAELHVFFKERLRNIFKDMGYRYDEINAIVEVSIDNPLECLEKISAISTMRGSQDFHAVSFSFKRIKNIILKAGLPLDAPFKVNQALFESEEEKALGRLVRRIRPLVKRAIADHAYQKGFQIMASVRPHIDRFFDKVLVMAENPEVQGNRLALLGELLRIFYQLADVSEVVLNSEEMSA